ncbi:type VI secretion system protein TssA [Chitinimonas arctica]|uniref:Type VI secretion system protein TssA n=1 Tax=Chitinimonas arctica TaxID=2594795 RepID=A0A516SBB7_9NEIS|nr:type VI secretion system protein TssA [Chitinimonas arctica]QDQ25443.1 type VI secretion system protein TssA [Chitinimonas arctica]
MPVLDIETLLQDISSDAPCGEDLEYHPDAIELNRLLQGKPEVEYGRTMQVAEGPDWQAVERLALALSGRSHDLRIAGQLCRALLHRHGMAGFADGLVLLEGLLARHWDQLHPQLDPDDALDPTARLNALLLLSNGAGMVAELRTVALADSRACGTVTLRDIDVIAGHLSLAEGAAQLSQAEIDAVCLDVALPSLAATATALSVCCDSIGRIEALLTERVGYGKALNFAVLHEALRRARSEIDHQLARRVDRTGPASAPALVDSVTDVVSEAPSRRPGEVSGRDDVLHMLEQICAYYERQEPSSPIPILLKRARRLVPMNFVEILADLAPESLGGIHQLGGTSPG